MIFNDLRESEERSKELVSDLGLRFVMGNSLMLFCKLSQFLTQMYLEVTVWETEYKTDFIFS